MSEKTRKARGDRPWDPGEDRMLPRLAEFGDVAFLAKVYGRSEESIEERLAKFGITPAPPRGEQRPEEVFWCRKCKRARSALNALGECPVCVERRRGDELRRRRAVLQCQLGPLELNRWMRENVSLLEAADLIAQRAENLRLGADVETLDAAVREYRSRAGLRDAG